MLRLARVLLPVALVFVLVGVAPSAPPDVLPVPPRMELPSPPEALETWEKTAREHKLTEAEIKLLRAQKFLVTGTALRQVFSPYTGSKVPVFITSDSILNAYHVLLEESIYRMELTNSRKLPGVLDRIAKNLDASAASFKEDEALAKSAKARAAIFIGVARNLLDDKALPADVEIKTTVQAEVRRIGAGTGASKPAWLGPPDDGFVALDYSRFTPRGFYTRTPVLQRYFRAVAWLQAIPFRSDKDDELAAFLLMRHAFFEANKDDPNAAIWTSFRAFLGASDDWDLSTWWLPKELTKAAVGKLQQDHRTDANGPQINDQLRFAPTEAGAKPELAFRFLSAYRLPDAVMFQRTMAPGGVKRDFSAGLEVATALGSPFARKTLEKDRPKLLKEIDAARPLFKSESLYADYLKCLGTLMERTEPDAPEFMRGEPWRIKTTQTALAGWAQMRHTWALQAKISIVFLSDMERRAGFIEPVPEFYGSLKKLVDGTTATLKAAGALVDDEKAMLKEFGDDFRAAEQLVKKVIAKKSDIGSLTREERDLVTRVAPHLDELWDLPEKERKSEKTFAELEFFVEVSKFMGQPGTPDEYKSVARMLEHWSGQNAWHWSSLSEVCGKLEVLAHKQLRQVPFTDDENTFIKNYGKNLAAIMLYGGNSWLHPRDDAMRVVDVYSNNGQHLHVGIARPRIMWVLYPTKNGVVLCRGAIVPYAEFANSTRLTDREWKTLLDSSKKPDIPAWAKPVIPREKEDE